MLGGAACELSLAIDRYQHRSVIWQENINLYSLALNGKPFNFIVLQNGEADSVEVGDEACRRSSLDGQHQIME